MRTITFWKVNIFSIGKELDESILIFPKLWLILFVTPLFLLIGYLILSQILLKIKQILLILLSRDIKNPSFLSNLIRNGLGPVRAFYKTL